MNFDPNNFKYLSYGSFGLYFDSGYSFHNHFGHKLKTRKFPYYKNISQFFTENADTKLYFTLAEEVKSFQRIDGGFLVNMAAYQQFCRTIGSKTGGRLKAFLGQNLSLRDANATGAEKDDFIKINATEENILVAIHNLDSETQSKILKALKKTEEIKDGKGISSITKEQFLSAFNNFLSDEKVQASFFQQTSKIQIETLKKLLIFLEENLDKGEKYIQEWIDEENGSYRKQRCLIFGLEYVDPKREGELNRKKFDILAEQDREHHILIELKSPNADIFDVKETGTPNEGKTTEYSLSEEMARAIPQVLGYKEWYENASAEELQKLGINKEKEISKCIIIIGKNIIDDVWKGNLSRLRNSLSRIEILTYTELIDKMKNTIKNIEENLAN